MIVDCKKTVDEFLFRYGMHYKRIDAEQSLKDFIGEMTVGLARTRPCSLQMIPSYIYETDYIGKEESVIAVDIGGTHVRIAEVHFLQDGTPEILRISKYETPGTKTAVYRDTFFREIARYLKPFIGRNHLIGCCFSFAIRPEKNGDAVVIATGKQLMVPDLVGARVGENLSDALAAEGFPHIRIVVINDAVAVLLGGSRQVPGRQFDSSVGFIYGTGTNISYFEKSEYIPGVAPGRKMLINVESCGYDGFLRGDVDIEFDKKLSDFGIDQYEKMVAGKYQGALLLEIIRKAVHDGLFSANFATRVKNVTGLPSKELDEYLLRPYGTGILSMCCKDGSERDRTILYFIIDAMMERSAFLCAIVLGAVLCKTDSGRDPCRPAFIVAEGSTFYGSKRFRDKLNLYVDSLLNKDIGVYLDFFSVKEATLIGSAVAALGFEN